MRNIEDRKKAGKLVNKALKMKKNGELKPEYYEGEKIDYNVDPEEFDAVYDKAQKLQEEFGVYEKIAFEIECGNDEEFITDNFYGDDGEGNEDHTQLIFVGEGTTEKKLKVLNNIYKKFDAGELAEEFYDGLDKDEEDTEEDIFGLGMTYYELMYEDGYEEERIAYTIKLGQPFEGMEGEGDQDHQNIIEKVK